jgi:dihydroorotase
VFDPDLEWVASAAELQSAGKNTPHLNQTLRGRATMTLVDGRIVHQLDA